MTRFHFNLAILVTAFTIGCQERQPPSHSDERNPKPAAAKEQAPPESATAGNENPTPAMTKQDLDRIEAALTIKLPAAYRQFMPERNKEIAGYTYPLRGATELFLDDHFFLDAERLISENLQQREAGWAAAEAFPRWWKEYVLFGTNGGGDYYALRLDGKPGVWFMACDAGTIRLYAKSLDEFLAMSVEDIPVQLKKYERLEELWQQKARGQIDEAEFEKKWQGILDEF